ncbi:MAG TPA: glycosyltransferase family 4 protein, partial [Pyrinomonadaceae bacterium]
CLAILIMTFIVFAGRSKFGGNFLKTMKILSCNAPYNDGGLGKVLAQVVEEARSARTLDCYYTSRKKTNDPKGHDISLKRFRWLFHSLPLRYSLSWRDFLAADLFDRAVAKTLAASMIFHGFCGRAQHSFVSARKLGYQQFILESATSHISNVMQQHQRAAKAFPIEKGWLNRQQYDKTLQEYETADLIYVLSEYSRQTFLKAGLPEAKVQRRVLTVEPRFAPPTRQVDSGRFTIVYVGRLQVSKGLPVLLDAFKQIQDKDAQLILVGGYGSNGMESYLRRRIEADRRIKICPGDPLPSLHRADVLVHPSFEDGLGLAPLEALACGVPVIVTEDTGMKEYVADGVNGYVLPTGNVEALVDQLRAIRLRPLNGAFAPGFTADRVMAAKTQ